MASQIVVDSEEELVDDVIDGAANTLWRSHSDLGTENAMVRRLQKKKQTDETG